MKGTKLLYLQTCELPWYDVDMGGLVIMRNVGLLDMCITLVAYHCPTENKKISMEKKYKKNKARVVSGGCVLYKSK